MSAAATVHPVIDRNLAMEAVRVTEAAALAASRWMGKGDEISADRAAIADMHEALGSLDIHGTIVIGEGSEDEIDTLFVGEKVGSGKGGNVEVALCPLEGATMTARGAHEAMSVVAMVEEGGFFKAPPLYMNKIAVGSHLPEGLIDLDAAPGENLSALADAKGVEVADLVVCVLDRPRHRDIIMQIREAGARIKLIDGGDVSGAIATCRAESGVDIYMGIGGAREGVLAAAALGCVNGQMQGRLVFRNEGEKKIASDFGITDLNRKYNLQDMAHGDVTFAATGVTDGSLLTGARFHSGGAYSHSLVMRSKTGTIRYIEAHHDFLIAPLQPVAG